jgi:hypothetical protein
MALTYDLSRIKDWQVVCVDGDGLNPVTQALIFKTMDVGIGEITSDNWREFAARLELCEDVFGAMLTDGEGGNVRLTPEDVYRHIGLKTNVFPKESWATFYAKLRKDAEQRVNREVAKLTAVVVG